MAWQLTGTDQGVQLLQPRELPSWRAMTKVCLSQPSRWERHPELPLLYRREGHGTRILLFESDHELDALLDEHRLSGAIVTRPVPPAARRHFQGLV